MASQLFTEMLIEFVRDKMRAWGVPERVQIHVIDNWDEIKKTLRENHKGDFTVRDLQLLLQEYCTTRMYPEEVNAVYEHTRMYPEEVNAVYEHTRNVRRTTELKNMSDRALLEALYKKLCW